MKRRNDMATTTLSYEIEVKDGSGNELASGALTIVIVTTSGPPPTRTISGTFTPTNGTAITINVPTWNTTAPTISSVLKTPAVTIPAAP
jgi:phage protein D